MKVIADYAYALTTLDRFDHGTLVIEEVTRPAPFLLTYDAAMDIVKAMQLEFGGLFGLEKDQGFKSALGAVYQTFGGEELYPSVEEKAANLLYFVVKNHAFSDGNKRIAAALFVAFLAGNTALYQKNGTKRIADNALVAMALVFVPGLRTRVRFNIHSCPMVYHMRQLHVFYSKNSSSTFLICKVSSILQPTL